MKPVLRSWHIDRGVLHLVSDTPKCQRVNRLRYMNILGITSGFEEIQIHTASGVIKFALSAGYCPIEVGAQLADSALGYIGKDGAHGELPDRV